MLDGSVNIVSVSNSNLGLGLAALRWRDRKSKTNAFTDFSRYFPADRDGNDSNAAVIW